MTVESAVHSLIFYNKRVPCLLKADAFSASTCPCGADDSSASTSISPLWADNSICAYFCRPSLGQCSVCSSYRESSLVKCLLRFHKSVPGQCVNQGRHVSSIQTDLQTLHAHQSYDCPINVKKGSSTIPRLACPAS